MRKLMVVLAAIVLAFASGCAAISERLERIDTDSVALQLMASQTSARFIQQADRDEWEERAREIVRIIEVTRLYVESGASVTVAELVERVSDQIPWDRLTPADEALILELYALYRPRLEERIGSGELSSDAKVNVMALLEAFERGTRPFLR